MSVLDKVKSEYLPKAVKKGKFGSDKVRFVDYQPDPNYKAVDQFATTIYFGDVILETNAGTHVSQSVVIKAQAGGKLYEASDDFSYDTNLLNELLFYSEVLPLLCRCDPEISKIFPKCFYAHAVPGDPANDLLIFDNVQKQGFKMSPWRTFNDYNHIKLTMEWAGKFHALSLVAKRKFPEQFKAAVSKIKECQWTPKRLNGPDAFYKENCKRGVKPLQNDPNYRDKLADLIAVVEEADLSMGKVVTAVEPLSVICHGDFCRNNIFYRYDPDGTPKEVIFFDLATMRYASPVIDLSFYLFMNSSPETKSSHWEDILLTYHSALTSNPDLDPEVTPSLEDLKRDFQRRGFYGYVHAAFYLPMMLDDLGGQDEWWKMNVEDITQLRLRTGGEMATQYVTKIVKHMIDQRFDFKFIKDFKLNVPR